MLAKLLDAHFLAGGLGFLRNDADRPAHRQAALRVLEWARAQLDQVDMLVLDESLYALGSGIVERQELEAMAAARAQGRHLVLWAACLIGWLRRQTLLPL